MVEEKVPRGKLSPVSSEEDELASQIDDFVDDGREPNTTETIPYSLYDINAAKQTVTDQELCFLARFYRIPNSITLSVIRPNKN